MSGPRYYLDHVTPADDAGAPGEPQRWRVEWPPASLGALAIDLQADCARAVLRVLLPPEALDRWFLAAWSGAHSRVCEFVAAWDRQHPGRGGSLADFVWFTPKGGRSVHLFMLHTLRRWPSARRLAQYMQDNRGSDWDLGLTFQAAAAARALGLGPDERAALHARLAGLHRELGRCLRVSLGALLGGHLNPDRVATLATQWEQIVRRLAAGHPELAALVVSRDLGRAVDVSWAPDARCGRVFQVRRSAVPRCLPCCVSRHHIVHHAQGRRHVVLDCSLERTFLEIPWSVRCEVEGRPYRIDVAAHLLDLMFAYDMPEGTYPAPIVSANLFHAPPITLRGGAVDGLLHASPQDLWCDLVRMLFVESTFCCLVTKLSKKLHRLVYTAFAVLERWQAPSLARAERRALLAATLRALAAASDCVACEGAVGPQCGPPPLAEPADVFAPMLAHFRRSYCVLHHLSRTPSEAWPPCVGATLGWTGFTDQAPEDCRYIQRPWRLDGAPSAAETDALRRGMDACRATISECLRDLLDATATTGVEEDWDTSLAAHIATEGWART